MQNSKDVPIVGEALAEAYKKGSVIFVPKIKTNKKNGQRYYHDMSGTLYLIDPNGNPRRASRVMNEKGEVDFSLKRIRLNTKQRKARNRIIRKLQADLKEAAEQRKNK